MIEPPSLYKFLLTGIFGGIIATGGLWLVALIRIGSAVRDSTVTGAYMLAIGGMDLGAITKTVNEHGSIITITVASGLAWLGMICVGICVCGAMVAYRIMRAASRR